MLNKIKTRFTTRFATHVLAGGLAAAQFLAPSSAALAQQRSLPIVRDAEIETLVRDYSQPILRAAGLSKSGIDIVLVNDRSFNAFVVGRRMFINTGALMTAETPNEIIGVIAHEAGHIAGGHQERLRQQLARAQTMAIVAGLLGMGAAIGGALSDSGGLAGGGAGLAMGGAEMARRSLLSYQRTEETTADRSALHYLDATGQSAQGMLDTFKRFASSLALSGAQVDPYQISHPMPRERIANLTAAAQASPYFSRKDPSDLQLRHDMIRAKIAAYTGGTGAAARIFRSNPRSLPGRYGDAISTHLYGSPRNALSKIDGLIRERPNNPYFHEMRGEILMKANQPAEAARAYSAARKLDRANSPIIQIAYGQALLATGNRDSVREAVRQISAALDRDREIPSAYRYLAQAHGQLGEIGEAELATAEGHYYSGQIQDARLFATRSQQKFKPGSPNWIRAQDIINAKPPRRQN
ncbi:M48 family metalloprotease [Mesorhizobium xinjiangense]|uniref:M48 family metalloprotease n=1 Tax=Mesorhizobium xinjiangense TaxID=2678685 RepID=UPI0012EE47A4|nr:M48 family metalloprotease [Mesorhizobium xinjiangense]